MLPPTTWRCTAHHDVLSTGLTPLMATTTAEIRGDPVVPQAVFPLERATGSSHELTKTHSSQLRAAKGNNKPLHINPWSPVKSLVLVGDYPISTRSLITCNHWDSLLNSLLAHQTLQLHVATETLAVLICCYVLFVLLLFYVLLTQQPPAWPFNPIIASIITRWWTSHIVPGNHRYELPKSAYVPRGLWLWILEIYDQPRGQTHVNTAVLVNSCSGDCTESLRSWLVQSQCYE